MKKTLLALAVIAATTAQAEHHKKVELSDIDKCYMNAVEKYPGHVLSMESEVEKDRLIYEFDIMTKDGKEVEVEFHIGFRENLEKSFEIHLANSHFLQFSQCDLTHVEVHSSHHGAFDDVIQGIATSRCNGDYMVIIS